MYNILHILWNTLENIKVCWVSFWENVKMVERWRLNDIINLIVIELFNELAYIISFRLQDLKKNFCCQFFMSWRKTKEWNVNFATLKYLDDETGKLLFCNIISNFKNAAYTKL